MNKLRHAVGALVIIGVLLSLSLDIYYDFQEGYGFTEEYVGNNGERNILESLNNLLLIDAVEDYAKAINAISTPENIQDVIGGLLTAGLGVLKTIAGIIIFPVQILAILGDYFYIPAIVSRGLGVLFTIYVWFIILSAVIGRDI